MKCPVCGYTDEPAVCPLCELPIDPAAKDAPYDVLPNGTCTHVACVVALAESRAPRPAEPAPLEGDN